MSYPGRIVRLNEPNSALVASIAAQLSARGYASTSPPGVYDARFKALVSLFQSQNADVAGRPLRVDGEVGPMTWSALFGAAPVVVAPTGLAGAALGVAISQIGVLESPLGSNRGPQVDQYLASVGVAPGNFWCMAFVFWSFEQGASQGGPNLFPKTAGCLDAWKKVKKAAPARAISRQAAIADPTLVKPGVVFILDHGGGHGHTGFVRQSIGGALRTVEGNTNVGGGSNGLGVFELNRRNVMDPTLKGFIDFT